LNKGRFKVKSKRAFYCAELPIDNADLGAQWLLDYDFEGESPVGIFPAGFTLPWWD
jgi:hypothetical protein